MSSDSGDNDVFSDDDVRKYVEPYVTSGGQRVWLSRHPEEPHMVDDPLRLSGGIGVG